MTDYNEEYYFLILGWSLEYRDPKFDLSRGLNLRKPIDAPENPIDLYVRPPIADYSMGEYHALFGIERVVSERIKNVMEEMNPVNTQFLPACIHKGKNTFDGYFIIHCYHWISCMDKQNSVWTKSHNPMPEREVLSIDKLVLDDTEIKNIPVSERLIFRVKECSSYLLFHKSVVDEIRKLKRSSVLGFVTVKDWETRRVI